MPIRITGLASGLDTEALVSELVSAYRLKTQKYTKAQTKLSWKQEIWKGLNSKVSSFYHKLDSLRLASASSLRTATVSDPTKAKVSAAAGAVNGTQTLSIDKVAKSGYLTGAQLGSGITKNSKLSDLGFTGKGTISVTSGGKQTDIDVTAGTTVQDFVSKLNGAGVKASYDSTYNRIYVSAKDTGVENDFSLVGTKGDGADALYALGLSQKSDANTQMYKEWADYARNTAGQAYFTVTTDADGKTTYTPNGTYDQTETDNYIQSVRTAAAKASSDNAKYTAQINYAEAYDFYHKAMDKLTSQEQNELNNLITLTDPDKVYVDAAGNQYTNVTENADGTYSWEDTNGTTHNFAAGDLEKASSRLYDLEMKAGLSKVVEEKDKDGNVIKSEVVLDASKVKKFGAAIGITKAFEGDPDNAAMVSEVKASYATNDIETLKKNLQGKISTNNAFLSNNALVLNATESTADVAEKITTASKVLNGDTSVAYNKGATRIDGSDSKITLNGATYESALNTYTINGLTITALESTPAGSELAVTTVSDTEGMFKKVKDFLNEYNSLINEFTSLYNADTARGFEPLTAEEKDAMTDTEVEEWEKKIKDSLLRRDDSLESLMGIMQNAMYSTFKINGDKYSLSSFGISTLGVLYADEDKENAYHIDGDPDDTSTSSKTNKLMNALNSDPDVVMEFMKQLSSKLYEGINNKMKSSTLSSFSMVYNDKEMAKEYSDYTTTIKKWEEKLTDIENSYYKKFSAMESALAVLQSQQSSLANLLGG